jgi:hypothetical protein
MIPNLAVSDSMREGITAGNDAAERDGFPGDR